MQKIQILLKTFYLERIEVHTEEVFPALPKSSHRSQILLCPPEDNMQPAEISAKGFTGETALLSIHSRPYTRRSKSRQDVLGKESRWKKKMENQILPNLAEVYNGYS